MTPSRVRSGLWLKFSKCGAGLLGLILAMVADLLHLSDYQLQFFVLCVEVWRDAHAGAGAIIDNEFAANQFFRDRGGVVVPNCDRAAALRWIFRTGDAKASFFGEGDQGFSLPHALFANGCDTNFVDDFVAGLGCIQSRDCRRA